MDAEKNKANKGLIDGVENYRIIGMKILLILKNVLLYEVVDALLKIQSLHYDSHFLLISAFIFLQVEKKSKALQPSEKITIFPSVMPYPHLPDDLPL